jgi:hypothetical protein
LVGDVEQRELGLSTRSQPVVGEIGLDQARQLERSGPCNVAAVSVLAGPALF